MADTKAERPISPHLSIYTPLINMVMSIVHRITGAALYVGMALVAWWLLALADGPRAYGEFEAVAGSVPGQVVLIGFTWALAHHMLGGIRHLIWDTGRGFNLATVDWLSWGTLVGSVALTVLFWVVAVWAR